MAEARNTPQNRRNVVNGAILATYQRGAASEDGGRACQPAASQQCTPPHNKSRPPLDVASRSSRNRYKISLRRSAPLCLRGPRAREPCHSKLRRKRRQHIEPGSYFAGLLSSLTFNRDIHRKPHPRTLQHIQFCTNYAATRVRVTTGGDPPLASSTGGQAVSEAA